MDRISGFIVFFLGLGIFWEGRKISIGSLSAPGPRFYPTILAVLLMILSLFLIIPKKKKENEVQSFSAWSPGLRRLLLAFAALLGYYFSLEYLGFLIAGFLLMTFLFAVVASYKWYIAVLGAFISIGLAYILFGVLMKSYFPKGVLGF